MKKIGLWLAVGFELVLIVSLAEGIRQTLGARGRVKELVAEKRELLAERKELAEELEYVQSPEYLEKVAREELALVKPGETVVIIPEKAGEQEEGLGTDEEVKANWEKWWEVYFGKMD